MNIAQWTCIYIPPWTTFSAPCLNEQAARYSKKRLTLQAEETLRSWLGSGCSKGGNKGHGHMRERRKRDLHMYASSFWACATETKVPSQESS